MRKRSKYRPKGVRLDTMAWLKQGMTPLAKADDQAVMLKIKNHQALEALRRGEGTLDDCDTVISALNIADAMACGGELGDEYARDIRAGQEALFNMAQRGYDNGGRFLFTGPELTAVNLAMEVHDAQLDICTISDVEAAIYIVERMRREGRTRKIQK